MPTLNNTLPMSYVKDEIGTKKMKKKPITDRNGFKKQGTF